MAEWEFELRVGNHTKNQHSSLFWLKFGPCFGGSNPQNRGHSQVPGTYICAMVKSRYIGDGHPTFNRNPYNGYINPYVIGLSFPSPIIWIEIMGLDRPDRTYRSVYSFPGLRENHTPSLTKDPHPHQSRERKALDSSMLPVPPVPLACGFRVAGFLDGLPTLCQETKHVKLVKEITMTSQRCKQSKQLSHEVIIGISRCLCETNSKHPWKLMVRT